MDVTAPVPTIPLVADEAASSDARELFDELRAAVGFVPNLVRFWAHSPLLFRAAMALELAVTKDGKVPAALKELAAARVSELNRCPYCKAFHHARLQQLDIDADKAATLADPHLPSGLFSEEERAVLQLADEMTLDVQARAETVTRVKRLFGVEGAVELMAVIGMLNLDNRIAFSAGLEPDVWPRR